MSKNIYILKDLRTVYIYIYLHIISDPEFSHFALGLGP